MSTRIRTMKIEATSEGGSALVHCGYLPCIGIKAFYALTSGVSVNRLTRLRWLLYKLEEADKAGVQQEFWAWVSLGTTQMEKGAVRRIGKECRECTRLAHLCLVRSSALD